MFLFAGIQNIALAAVLNAFIADHALLAETMYVHVSDGTVMLSSRVDFPYQREEAEKVALGVPGDSQLCNHLSVWILVSVNEVTERVTNAIGEDGADQLTVSALPPTATRRSPRRRARRRSSTSRTRSASWRDCAASAALT